MTQKVMSKSKYDAFISYSHAADGRLASALQKALHRFAKPLFKLRAMRVFRDETTLAMTPHLWPTIESKLRESRFFILLADTLSAESEWVQREVTSWIESGRADKMLIVWTGGDLIWDEEKGDFDWEKTTALSKSLTGAFHGEVPLYLDLRWSRTELQLSRRDPRFASAVARLSATIRDQDLDQAFGDDVREQRRSFRFLVAGIMVLCLAVLFAGWRWWKETEARSEAEDQRDQAEKQKKIAQERLSDSFRDRGLELLKAGDSRQGLAFLVAALRADPTSDLPACRLLLELRTRDWLLPTEVFPFVPTMISSETESTAGRFLSGDGEIEVRKSNPDGQTERFFCADRKTGAWRPAEESSEPSAMNVASGREEYDFLTESDPESPEQAAFHPEFESTEANGKAMFPDIDFWFHSPDGRWTVGTEAGEVPPEQSDITVLDRKNLKPVAIQEHEKFPGRITGIPAFDPKRPVVWLHSVPLPDVTDAEKFSDFEISAAWLLGLEITSGKLLVEEIACLNPANAEGRLPKISGDGSRLILRFVVPNREGESAQTYQITGTESALSAKEIAEDLSAPGRISDLSFNGKDILVVTPAAAIIYELSPSPPFSKISGEFDGELHREQFAMNAASPDGQFTARVIYQGVIRIFRAGGSNPVRIDSEYIDGEWGRSVQHIEFSPDSRWLLVWGGVSTGPGRLDTEVYDAQSGRLIFPRFVIETRLSGGIQRFMPDGRTVELLNGTLVPIRLADVPVPSWFLALAEEIVGAYVTDSGVYQVLGNSDSRLPLSAAARAALIPASEANSAWARFVDERFRKP
jgi:hypothetical protein